MLDTVKRTIFDYMMLKLAKMCWLPCPAVRIPQRFC